MTPNRSAIAEVEAFMRKHHLTGDDLVDYGGAELKSRDQRVRKRAEAVELCWELMARLHVTGQDIPAGRTIP